MTFVTEEELQEAFGKTMRLLERLPYSEIRDSAMSELDSARAYAELAQGLAEMRAAGNEKGSARGAP